MCIRRVLSFAFLSMTLLGVASPARAQGITDESRWAFDVGVGISPSVNGNINSGAIGTLQGQATAIVPHSYGSVYGTGPEFHFGGGFKFDERTELRGTIIYQSADADLVRLGDLGASPLYGQYSDYKALSLDFGYRRYMPISSGKIHLFGEATIGIGAIDRINVKLAAPQSNVILDNKDFYDGTSAFTWSLGGGVLFPVSTLVDFSAQLGLRHVGGMAAVDQFAGTGLETITNDSARLTFPIVVGVRLRFK